MVEKVYSVYTPTFVFSKGSLELTNIALSYFSGLKKGPLNIMLAGLSSGVAPQDGSNKQSVLEEKDPIHVDHRAPRDCLIKTELGTGE